MTYLLPSCNRLLHDDLIEIINKKLIELQNKERRKIRKETKRTAKQYKFCEKLLKKAYSKYNNILYYEFWRNDSCIDFRQG